MLESAEMGMPILLMAAEAVVLLDEAETHRCQDMVGAVQVVILQLLHKTEKMAIVGLSGWFHECICKH
jgi:hypothetical protein